MNREFDQEPDDSTASKGGSNTRVLLLVLLLLVAVFGYLYYFTGLIRPRAEVPQPQPAATTQVKQPIPPRPGAEPAPAAAEAGKQAETAAGKKTAESKPAPVKAEQAPAMPAKSQQAKTAPVKPEALRPAKSEAPKSGTGKPEAPKAGKIEAPKAAKPESSAKQVTPKPAVAVKHQPAVKPEAKATKEAPAAKAKLAKEKTAKATSAKVEAVKKPSQSRKPEEHGEYTLKIGDYVVPSAMDKVKGKLHAAGLSPVVKQGPKVKEPMIRLYFGEYADQESARKELAKLHDATAEAFMLNEGGTYRVYAGSYFLHERALKERDRLAGQGVKVTLKNASVPVPTLLLTAGSFSTRTEALKAVGKLKKQGLAASVIEKAP